MFRCLSKLIRTTSAYYTATPHPTYSTGTQCILYNHNFNNLIQLRAITATKKKRTKNICHIPSSKQCHILPTSRQHAKFRNLAFITPLLSLSRASKQCHIPLISLDLPQKTSKNALHLLLSLYACTERDPTRTRPLSPTTIAYVCYMCETTRKRAKPSARITSSAAAPWRVILHNSRRVARDALTVGYYARYRESRRVGERGLL